MSVSAKCPTCKKGVALDGAAFPFCSPRCRLVDLGNWMDGRYVIPGSPMTDEGATEGSFFETDVDVPDDPRMPKA